MPKILIGYIKGPKGDTGTQGKTGPAGPIGPQGPLPPLVNDYLTTEAGVAAADAAILPDIDNRIKGLNSDLANRDIESGTILDYVTSHLHSDAFVVGTYYPPDCPEQTEGYVQILRGTDGARTIVQYIPFSVSEKYYYKRTIFSGNWNHEWVKFSYN